jgi:catechol 2,3-dioxygenase
MIFHKGSLERVGLAMTELTASKPLTGIQISQVHLRTANLTRMLHFYTKVLGLKVLGSAGSVTSLSATGQEPALIRITEEPTAPARNRGTPGLFHIALLFPTRPHLAESILRLAKHHYPIDGASDHIVSEAIYLRDPDGNGIELYADRPKSEWVWKNGQVGMSTEALDLESLLHAGYPNVTAAHLSPSTRIGHLHLQVSNLETAQLFYHDFLGLAVTQRDYPGALFFATDGYHHHVAVNTWGVKMPKSGNAMGLVSYSLKVAERDRLLELNDRVEANIPSSDIQTDSEGAALRLRDPAGVWLELS